MMKMMKKSTLIRTPGRRKYFVGWPNMTALIDVMFLMLIFFMISSSFVRISGIKVDLPKVGTINTLDVEKFVLSVVMVDDNKWEIYFNDQVISDYDNNLDKLKKKLADIRNPAKTGTIILRAGNKVPFPIISKIMVVAAKANFSVFLATLPAEHKVATAFNPEEK